jgi:hypothetical protein
MRRLEVGLTLGEAAGVYPGQLVADDPACVLEGADEAMMGAGAAEGEEVAAGLGDSEGFAAPLFAPGLKLLRVRPGIDHPLRLLAGALAGLPAVVLPLPALRAFGHPVWCE